ncbi:NAK protein kinase [Cryptococcus wingfieldii CBS 7118]|uniref:non-specific serine/threonine protein kinase n=1 Tax=Cryptococcus wingfieldii CBS 7118 TaxID=1295528 RepID=A0A1E3JEI7_9TREE|nr:NAK protein kinase [Cryptococcus wingfieldii CBS 7118]ODN98516.1 NAK protein kinase [Cryptococcus wingfieldii CBS 7118]
MYPRSPQHPAYGPHAPYAPQQYYHHPYPQPPPQPHKGTLPPGHILSVADQQVRIERYLSEGGYAHVYLTTSERPIYTPSRNPDKKGRWGEKGYTQHCLKRIAFQDDHVWVDVKKEIEVMKSLPPNPHLVQYLGHSHARLQTGGHEVFILMEFCSGGGIIDLLNKRLRDRLKEIEILNIFTDVCEIENVLSQPLSSPPTPQRPTPLMFKLCDFGSTTFPTDRPPQTKLEADALAMDLNKNTTLQYRSPEMVEPMLGLPVGLPSGVDVWALGCLLYKLCYYTTPFEEHGPLAIVNAKYTFPPVPQYSPRLQHLIASMLVEQPVRRPTVFEVLRMSHEMSGTRPEVDYPIPSRSIPQHAPRPTKPHSSASSNNLLDMSDSPSRRTPVMQPSMVPSVQPQPQRRGRPAREGGAKPTTPGVASPQPSPGWQYTPKGQQPQPTSSAALVKPTPKVQITDTSQSFSRTAPSSAIAKSPSPVDAFGMPALASQKTTSSGFGDAFGVPPSGVRGMQTGASTMSPRFGQGVPSKKPSGFSDSFSNTSNFSLSSRPGVSQLPSGPRPPSSASTASTRTTRQQLTSSPSSMLSRQQTNQSSSQPSSIPEGDLSFESRYPSVETLDSEDGFTPPVPDPERLISPMVSPPSAVPTGASSSTTSSNLTQSNNFNTARPSQPRLFTRPSLMGNLTGGDLKSPPLSENREGLSKGQQARSTHVTGTAFRDQKSPAPTQPANQAPQGAEIDYFGPLESGDEKEPIVEKESVAEKAETPEKETEVKPKNLMDDEDPSLLQVPLLPGRSTSPSSASGQSSPGKPTSLKLDATGAAQATGRSNIMSEEWSPLQDMRRKDAEERTRARERAEKEKRDADAGRVTERTRSDDPEVDSSEDDEGPEEPNRFNRPPPPAKSPVASPRPSTQRVPSGDRTRPQSMFLPSTNSYSRPSARSPGAGSPSFASPPNTFVSQPSAGATGGSGLDRKSSINGIVSRYEDLTVSGNTTARDSSRRPVSQYGAPPADTRSNTNGLSRKPSVASKPMALRKSTAEIGQSQPSTSPTKPSQVSPVSPVKPKTATQAKPVAENNNHSGSTYVRPGMTRPVVKPKPTLNTTLSQSKNPASPIVRAQPPREQQSGGRADDRLEKSSSGSQSPEKQQPVNALIQRWNKGEVNNSSANISRVNRGGYI